MGVLCISAAAAGSVSRRAPAVGALPALEAVQPTYPAYGEVRCADEDGAVTMSPEARDGARRNWTSVNAAVRLHLPPPGIEDGWGEARVT